MVEFFGGGEHVGGEGGGAEAISISRHSVQLIPRFSRTINHGILLGEEGGSERGGDVKVCGAAQKEGVETCF